MKVEQPEGMKKGCQWGINPSREAFLEHEMNKWLKEDNKSWDQLSSKYGKWCYNANNCCYTIILSGIAAGINSPMYCDVERPSHSSSHDGSTHKKQRTSRLLTESKQLEQLELQALSVASNNNNPMMSSNDPLLHDPDITDAIAALQTVVAEEIVSTSYSPPTKQPFDFNESPSKYTLSCSLIPQDENGVAKSLFGLDLSPPKNYWDIYPCYNLYNQEYKSYLVQLEEKQASGDLDDTDDDIINNQCIVRAMKQQQLQNNKSELPDLSYFEQLSEQTSGVLQYQDVECVNDMQLDNMVLNISRDFLTLSPHKQLNVSEELNNL